MATHSAQRLPFSSLNSIIKLSNPSISVGRVTKVVDDLWRGQSISLDIFICENMIVIQTLQSSKLIYVFLDESDHVTGIFISEIPQSIL